MKPKSSAPGSGTNTLILGNELALDRCPHCAINLPHLRSTGQFETTDSSGHNKRRWATYRCVRCGGALLAGGEGFGAPVRECYPHCTEVDKAVPTRAREYLQQAINSLHAPAGAIMLTASAVDAMLKEKGYKEGSLNTRIDKAAAAHLITADMATWAHHVRLDANDQRHSDESAPLPTMDDAKRCIEFAQALAEFMFVLPGRIARGMGKAAASVTA